MIVKPEEALILVVEDHDMLRDMIFKRMMIGGFQYTYFMKTAGEAMGFLCRAKPVDLVLMDLILDPRDAFQNGCEAGFHIKKHWPRVRQLYMTGFGKEEVERMCPPGTEWIAKPFVLEELMAKITEVLSR